MVIYRIYTDCCPNPLPDTFLGDMQDVEQFSSNVCEILELKFVKELQNIKYGK